MRFFLLAFIPLLIVVSAIAGAPKLEDVFNNNGYQEFAKSVAIQLNLRDDFKYNNGFYSGRFESLGTILSSQYGSKKVSQEEPFRNQLSVGHCTATLIGKDLILTAGHCVPTKAHCKITGWKFDFFSTPYNEERLNRQVDFKIPTSSVYTCKKIKRIQPNWNLFNTIGTQDYAIIKLDRKVILESGGPRPHLKVADEVVETAIPDIFTLGFPFGLPMKVSYDSGMEIYGKGFGVSKLVAYPGNSGSSIVDASTGEIIGILSSGDPSDMALEDIQGELLLRHRVNDYEHYIFLVSKKILKL